MRRSEIIRLALSLLALAASCKQQPDKQTCEQLLTEQSKMYEQRIADLEEEHRLELEYKLEYNRYSYGDDLYAMSDDSSYWHVGYKWYLSDGSRSGYGNICISSEKGKIPYNPDIRERAGHNESDVFFRLSLTRITKEEYFNFWLNPQ